MKYLLLFSSTNSQKKKRAGEGAGEEGGEALWGRTLQNISSLKITLGLLQQSLSNLDSYFYMFFCPCRTE